RYTEYYEPKPFIKRYVQRLDMCYAHSHPAEHFAETFAVWLRPSSRWRPRYRDWPALKKLEYVDELMKEIAPQKPPAMTRKQFFRLARLKKTLREYYQEKRAHYARGRPDFYDNDLRKLFSDDRKFKNRPTDDGFLRSYKH